MAILKFFFRVWFSLLPLGVAVVITGFARDDERLVDIGGTLVAIFVGIMLTLVLCFIWTVAL